MTERDIEVEGKSLVIKTDGRVVRSPVPADIDPKMFRHVVAAVDMLYRRDGVIPTEAEIMRQWEGFSKKAVHESMASQEMKDALSLRGVDWEPKMGLSALQLNAILLLQDPTDPRSTRARLADIGVSMSTYRAWMRNRAFAEHMNSQAEANLGDAVQMAINRMISQAETGDMRAIEKVLEVSGRYNPQQTELQNARTILSIFFEELEKHADTDVIRSVLEGVQARTRAITIMQSIKE